MADLPFETNWPGTLQRTIPSYLYTEYNDDPNLQALVNGYNNIAQQYVDLFNQIGLPVYTGSMISGSLLDWVGVGLYDTPRPTLPSGSNRTVGPFNTWTLNTLVFNTKKIIDNTTYYVANDDVYKRTITWHFYKGDGKYFAIDWLKRRVVRFLNGSNGTAPAIDNTYDISVSQSGSAITITINNSASYAEAATFASAVESGALELPIQFSFSVTLA